MPIKPSITARAILFATVLAAAHFLAQAQEKSGAVIPGPAVPPLIIVAPAEVRTDPSLARGCWVRLFPEKAFQGTNDLTIAGPISVSSLHAPTGGGSGVYWKPKAESVIVGPKARVTLYESEGFRGKSVRLDGGTRMQELRSKFELPQSIGALTIDCEKP